MKSFTYILSLTIAAAVIAGCKKDEPTPPVYIDYNSMVAGHYTETYKSVTTSTDTSTTGDTTYSPAGKYTRTFNDGKVYYYTLSKIQETRKYSYDGTYLMIYDSTAQDGNAEKYTVDINDVRMKLNRKRKTSNGIGYTNEETNITLEKY